MKLEASDVVWSSVLRMVAALSQWLGRNLRHRWLLMRQETIAPTSNKGPTT